MTLLAETQTGSGEDQQLFSAIANNLQKNGYSIHPNALPVELANALWEHLQQMPEKQFQEAGVGRESLYIQNHFVRKYTIS